MSIDKATKAKERTPTEAQETVKTKSTFREYAEAIGMALLLALFIRTFIVQAFKIPSGSMIPTLQIGDHILVNKLAYGIRVPLWGHYLVDFGKVQRGDVIVFIFPEDRSRILSSGLSVPPEIRWKSAARKYISTASRWRIVTRISKVTTCKTFCRPAVMITVRKGAGNHLFVMGDNRDRSYDSRFWGFVNLDDVRGKRS
jgi:signal peptidase I